MERPTDLPQIDLEPHEHSSSYELKPMSRWWLLPPLGMILLALAVGGLTNEVTWGAALGGVILGFCLILAFPKYFLSRLD